jgi:hypothetical protein
MNASFFIEQLVISLFPLYYAFYNGPPITGDLILLLYLSLSIGIDHFRMYYMAFSCAEIPPVYLFSRKVLYGQSSRTSGTADKYTLVLGL